MGWSGARVAQILGSADGLEAEFASISTDTRSLEPGALFVALEGDRFDGHRFLDVAREKGALAAVVRRGTGAVPGLGLFEVPDTLVALGLLARARRQEIPGPVVAVTGTSGKTSTKEMLRCVVGTRWAVHATRENLNNLVGVPLTILEAPEGCEALIVEAGANLPGEIARLRDIIDPSIALVTNVGAGHLEGFGSLEGVMIEKVSLLDGVSVAVVGTVPQSLANRARAVAHRVVTAGVGDSADVCPDDWGLSPCGSGWLVFGGNRVDLPLLGRHQIENAMLAVAVALELGCGECAIAQALTRVSLPPGRCERLDLGGCTLLQDTYNANPDSLQALLDVAEAIRGDRELVVVLGTMLELGSQSVVMHERMADRVMAARPGLVGVLGEFVSAFGRYASALGERLVSADDSEALGRALAGRLRGDEIVLIKGSHGVHMERAVAQITAGRSSEGRPCSTIS